MLQVKNTANDPPRSKWGRGWHYVQNGVVMQSGTESDLLKVVMEYRIANGLPFDNLRAEVHDWICRNTGAKCAPPRPTRSGDARQRTVGDVWRFLKAMAAWVTVGDLVTQEEAERRAEACSGCKFQTELPPGCFGCTRAYTLVSLVKGSRKTSLDHALKTCGVCGCYNEVQVWVPNEALDRAHGPLEYPEDTGGKDLEGKPVRCWRLENAKARNGERQKLTKSTNDDE